jgi:hypothetical protein
MSEVEVCCGPLARTIAVLAERSSLQQVEEECICDPWGVELAPKASLFGFLGTSFFTVFGALGGASSQTQTQTVLKTTRAALHALKDVLLHPTEENVHSFSGILSLAFDERWQRKCIWANALLKDGEVLPPFDKALRIMGPQIVHSVVAMPVPWEALQDLIEKRAVDPLHKDLFQQWVRELSQWGSHLSPLLMLSVCESAAVRIFGEEEQAKVAEAAFYLIFELYRSGLTWLAGTDSTFVINHFSFFGSKIPIEFPQGAHIEAYEDPKSPDSMVLVSPAPLYLGLWLNSMPATRSSIPFIRVESCDLRGRFVTTERLLGPCTSLLWDGRGAKTEHDRRLLYNIGTLCENLVQQYFTPTLDLRDLFVTSRLEICSLRPIGMQSPFLSLLAIESFISDMCQGDIERIREILDRSGFWNTQTVKMHRSLISTYAFEGTDADIRREIHVFGLKPELLPEVSAWVLQLKGHVLAACRVLQEKDSSTPVRPASLIKAVFRLQNEGGFLARLPPNLGDLIVAWVSRCRS